MLVLDLVGNDHSQFWGFDPGKNAKFNANLMAVERLTTPYQESAEIVE
jgi:hypothetical protein